MEGVGSGGASGTAGVRGVTVGRRSTRAAQQGLVQSDSKKLEVSSQKAGDCR